MPPAKKYKPSKIEIAGIEFQIIYKTMKDYGELDFEDRKIFISNELKGEALFDTIMHEALHAVLAMSGLSYIIEDAHDELEEAIVRSADNMFFSLFKKSFNEFSG